MIFALGVKELWQLKQPLDAVVHTMGWPLPRDVFGGSWFYPMGRKGENLASIGIVAGLDAPRASLDVHAMLQRMTAAPALPPEPRGGRKILVEEIYWIRGKKKKIITKKQREIYDLYMRNLEKLKEKDLLGEVDLTVLNFSIFVINWFFRWYREGGRLSKEEVPDNIWKLLFHGMLKASPPRDTPHNA